MPPPPKFTASASIIITFRLGKTDCRIWAAFLSFNLIIELDSVDTYYANLASIKSVNKDVKNFTRLLRNIQGIRSSHTKSRISGKGPSSPWQSSNKRSGKESKSSGK